MKHLIRFSAITLLFILFDSCDSNNDYSTTDVTPIPITTTFIAGLSGLQEVPKNGSEKFGSAVLIFNNTTKIFTITVNHTVASPTAGHLHVGSFGANGVPIFTFSTLASPFTYTSAALTEAQEADLNAELYYVNIHSATFPNGEIRGQLYKQIY